MIRLWKVLFSRVPIISLTLIVVSCGGGGGSSSGGGTVNSGGGSGQTPATPALPSVSDKSLNELITEYSELATLAYQGSSEPAAISTENIQEYLFEIFASPFTSFERNKVSQNTSFALNKIKHPETSIAKIAVNHVWSLAGNNATQKTNNLPSQNIDVEDEIACDNLGGVFILSGYVDDFGNGTLAFEFRNCNLGGLIYNGSGATYNNPQIDRRLYTFFDAVLVTDGFVTVQLDGYGGDSFDFLQTMTISDTESSLQTMVIDYTTRSAGFNASTVNGEILISERGMVTVETIEDIVESDFAVLSAGFLRLSSTNGSKAEISVDQYGLLVAIDETGDGEFDRGMAIADFDVSTVSPDLFVEYEDVDFPPSAENHYIQGTWHEINSTQELSPQPNLYIQDREGQEVEVSYHWLINGSPYNTEDPERFPAGVATRGDIITLVATLSDGNNTSTIEVSVDIYDARGHAEILNHSGSFMAGEAAEFDILFSDPDRQDDGAIPVVIDAPDNFVLNNNGLVSWDVPNPPFSAGVIYPVTLQNPESEQIFELKLRVEDNKENYSLVRSGIYPPLTDTPIQSGEWTDLTQKDLLVSSGDNLFSLTREGNDFYQTWVYPFSLGESDVVTRASSTFSTHASFAGQKEVLNHLRIFDTDNDGDNELVVATAYSVYLIEDLQSLHNHILSEIPTNSITDIIVEDLDEDGDAELLLHTHPIGASLDLGEVSLYDLNSGEELWQYRLSIPWNHEIKLGQVDSDPELDLVCSCGWVADAYTGSLTWVDDDFSEEIDLIDLDLDSVEEIIGITENGMLSVRSGLTEELLWEEDISSLPFSDNFCDISGINLNAAPTEEVVILGCEHDDAYIFDISGGSAVLLSDILLDGTPRSASSADTNNDGINEVILVDCCSFDENIVVTDLVSAPEKIWSHSNPTNMSVFESLGLSFFEQEPTTHFLAYDTDDAQGSPSRGLPRLVQMSNEGRTITSDALTSRSNDSVLSILGNFDDDVDLEYFLPPTSEIGSARIVDLEGFVVEEVDSRPFYGWQMLNVDLNGDGIDEIIHEHNDEFFAYDPAQQIELWSLDRSNYPVTFYGMSLSLTNEGIHELAVHSSHFLQTYSVTDTGMTLNKEVDVGVCGSFYAYQADDDAAHEYICINSIRLSSGSFLTDTEIFFYESDLTENGSMSLVGASGPAIVSKLPGETTDTLFLSIVEPEYRAFPSSDKTLAAIDLASRSLLWRTLPLNGNIIGMDFTPDPYSEGAYLSLGATKAMYLFYLN